MPRPSNEPRETRRTAETEPLHRRTVLGTAGVAIAAAVAGCTSAAKQQPAPEPLVDATAEVAPGQYQAFPFELDSEQWVTVDAHLSDRSVEIKQDGPAVDVVTMSAAQYSEFQSTAAFEYVGGASMPDVVVGQVSDTLTPGEYVALVDNSDAGATAPDGSGVTAVVQLEVSATDQRS